VYIEEFPDATSAIAREKQLKGWKRNRKLELALAVNPLWKDLSEDWDFFGCVGGIDRKIGWLAEVLRQAQDDGTFGGFFEETCFEGTRQIIRVGRQVRKIMTGYTSAVA
jgi:hypothetical protein